MKRKKCSFILPTKNVEKYIGPLLEAIYSQDFDGDIEVLIIDSSDDKTPEIAKSFPVKFYRVESKDYNNARTRNDGAAMTDGEFLVFLSTDVGIFDKEWLTKLTRHFSDPQVAGVFGRQLPRTDTTPMEQSFILQTYPAETHVMSMKDNMPARGMVYFSNTNTAIRRSVWKQIKLPEMIMMEDMEWAKQALSAGYKIVYDSEAAVYHSHRRSIKQSFQRYFTCGTVLPITHTNEIIKYSMKNFIIDGLRFVFNEYKYLIKNGYWYWIPYAIIYDIAKFLGTFLGTKQKYIPIWMKKVMCEKKHQHHWDKYKDAIIEPTLQGQSKP